MEEEGLTEEEVGVVGLVDAFGAVGVVRLKINCKLETSGFQHINKMRLIS